MTDTDGASAAATSVSARAGNAAGESEGTLFTLAGGRYAVEARLGEGAGGEVYAARDTVLERLVAIKRLPADARPRGTGATPSASVTPGGKLGTEARNEAAARLLAEARAIARLSHPNIVTVHDVFEEDGRLHLVLERVPGPTLRQRLNEQGRLSLEEVTQLAGQLAAALAHAHRHGIVHRDLKPENILLAPGGVAKLVDFGIARVPGQTRLTNPDEAIGTPAYVAPEQATGGTVDGRADLYALGCILFEALTGRPPFEGETPLLVISQHVYAEPLPPSALCPNVPPEWDAIVLALLAKRPDNRVPSAEALLGRLRRVTAGGRSPAPGAPTGPEVPGSEGTTGAPVSPPAGRRDTGQAEASVPARPIRVLAVDDDRDLTEVLEFLLRRAEYEPIVAYDGLEAWQRFQEDPPDLVVLDINMPGMDGFELLRRIRSLDGPAAATPVVMLTARNDEASIVEALDAGADDYIAKPFSPRQLTARLRASLRHAGRLTG